MPNKVFTIFTCSFRYILMVLIAYYINYLDIPSLYTINLLVILLLNYLIIKWGVIKVLNENDKVTKKRYIFPISINHNTI